MQSVSIQTTQNITIDYPLASLGDRILAYLIDILILGGYGFIMFFVFMGLFQHFEIWILIILYLPIFFYHLICEIMLEGQSIGKRQMKIKVVRLDGSPATIGSYVIRWMLRTIDNLIYGGVAMIFIAAGGKGQRLGDLAAGTTVIKLEKRTDIKNQLIVDQSDNDYEVTFNEVTNLNDRQIEIIRITLRTYKENANRTPVETLSTKIKEILNIEKEVPSVQFLHTVVKDYNHITSRS